MKPTGPIQDMSQQLCPAACCMCVRETVLTLRRMRGLLCVPNHSMLHAAAVTLLNTHSDLYQMAYANSSFRLSRLTSPGPASRNQLSIAAMMSSTRNSCSKSFCLIRAVS